MLQRADAEYGAARVIYPHGEAIRKVVDYIATLDFRSFSLQDREPVLSKVVVHVYYYVGLTRMIFTVSRSRTNVTASRANLVYYPPVPHADGAAIWGGPAETLEEVADLSARVEADVYDMDVFDQSVRRTEHTDVMSFANAFEAARATAGFWYDSKEEFIRDTWAPGRHADWCLPHDERSDLLAGKRGEM